MSGIFESLGIDSGIIIIILLILTVYLLIRNVNSNMRLSRLERRYKVFMKGSDAQSLEKVFVRKFAQIDRLYEAKDQHDHELLFKRGYGSTNWHFYFSKPVSDTSADSDRYFK